MLSFSQPSPCLKNKTQHPSSHTTVCKTGMLWGQGGVFQALGQEQRATMEKKPWCCGVLDTNAGTGSDLQLCAKLVSSASRGLPQVPDAVLLVVLLVLLVLGHGPGVHPRLPRSVCWSRLPLILQVIQQDHGATAAEIPGGFLLLF